MIEITNVRHKVLSIPGLAIPPGTTAIIGENGSGKTTLLRLIAGIDEPEGGSITIDGASPRTQETGYVHEFPDRNLLFSTVFDEIASSPRFRNLPCPQTSERVHASAAMVQVCHLLDRPVRDLSGGEKALAGIAAAIVNRPTLLVLDEFDSHLDRERCRQIDSAVLECGARYIIRCTQHMETAAAAQYVVALERGGPAHSGTPQEVFPHYRSTPFYPASWRKSAC